MSCFLGWNLWCKIWILFVSKSWLNLGWKICLIVNNLDSSFPNFEKKVEGRMADRGWNWHIQKI
jgi:hypothetical protein